MYDINHIVIARTVEEAINALKTNPKSEIISGGTDVLIKIREGKMSECSLVDISNIPELKGIEKKDNGDIIIKAATSFSHITNHKIVQENINVLGEAVDKVGGPQIRNMGTIGGNVCNGVTSADSASTLCAYNAVMMLKDYNGTREIPISKWYNGAGKTVRKHDEILIGIKITKDNYEGYNGFYIKYGKRNAMEIATLGCCVILKLSQDKKTINDIRIAYGVAAPNPIRCYETEAILKNKPLSNSILDLIETNVLKEINPRSSWRASREFRMELAQEMSKRAFIESVKRAGGEIYA